MPAPYTEGGVVFAGLGARWSWCLRHASVQHTRCGPLCHSGVSSIVQPQWAEGTAVRSFLSLEMLLWPAYPFPGKKKNSSLLRWANKPKQTCDTELQQTFWHEAVYLTHLEVMRCCSEFSHLHSESIWCPSGQGCAPVLCQRFYTKYVRVWRVLSLAAGLQSCISSLNVWNFVKF